MNNPFQNIIITTSIIVVSIIMFIGAAIDPALVFYWKVIVCVVSAMLIVGAISDLRDQSKKSKKFMSNREDLR